MNPPVNDLLLIAGTKGDITMPLCELMNGYFVSLEEGNVIMEDRDKRFTLSSAEFVSAIEKNMDYAGKVKKLQIWKKETDQPEEVFKK